jgi:regulatory protein YycI of two-component signal transduction system YycFG
MNITKKLLLLLFVTGLVFTACKKNVSDDKDKTLNDTTATTSNDTSVSINLNSPVADEKILLRFQPVVGNYIYSGKQCKFHHE